MDDFFEVDDNFQFYKKSQKEYQNELNQYAQGLFDELNNQSQEMMEKKMIFSSLMVDYLKQFDKTVQDDYSDVVPIEFELSDNIDIKCAILSDCIQNHFEIRNSSLFNDMLEQVVLDDIKEK